MILSEDQGNLRILSLDRPLKRNALSVEMLDLLYAHLTRVTADGPSAILIRGAGETFCAGFDLSACRDNPAALGQLLTSLYHVVSAIRSATCPVVIAAHGAAIAGGCALLCAADFVVTNTKAKLGYPVVRLGISPAVNAAFLRATIGDARTRELLLEGELIDGAAAHACGIASHCVTTPAEVETLAHSIARRLSDKPRLAVQATKRWLNQLDGTTNPAHTRPGLDTSLSIVGTDEQNERLARLWAR